MRIVCAFVRLVMSPFHIRKVTEAISLKVGCSKTKDELFLIDFVVVPPRIKCTIFNLVYASNPCGTSPVARGSGLLFSLCVGLCCCVDKVFAFMALQKRLAKHQLFGEATPVVSPTSHKTIKTRGGVYIVLLSRNGL
jgi:hypothetical protein